MCTHLHPFRVTTGLHSSYRYAATHFVDSAASQEWCYLVCIRCMCSDTSVLHQPQQSTACYSIVAPTVPDVIESLRPVLCHTAKCSHALTTHWQSSQQHCPLFSTRVAHKPVGCPMTGWTASWQSKRERQNPCEQNHCTQGSASCLGSERHTVLTCLWQSLTPAAASQGGTPFRTHA